MSTGTFQEVLKNLRDGLSEGAKELIDSTSRFGMPSATISSLQKSLSANVRAIDNAFNRYRTEFGSKFERGDTIACDAIALCVDQIGMTRRNSHRKRPRNSWEKSVGLSEGRMLDVTYNGIESDVMAAFEGLASRLSADSRNGGRGQRSQLPSFPSLGMRESNNRSSDGDVTISRHDMAMMVQHLRDSWIQESIGGQTVYVNVYEPSLRRPERPRNGFIRAEIDRGDRLGAFRGGLGRGVLNLGLGARGTGSTWDR